MARSIRIGQPLRLAGKNYVLAALDQLTATEKPTDSSPPTTCFTRAESEMYSPYTEELELALTKQNEPEPSTDDIVTFLFEASAAAGSIITSGGLSAIMTLIGLTPSASGQLSNQNSGNLSDSELAQRYTIFRETVIVTQPLRISWWVSRQNSTPDISPLRRRWGEFFGRDPEEMKDLPSFKHVQTDEELIQIFEELFEEPT